MYPENFGEDMSLDETCLSNGDVYTILTNKGVKPKSRCINFVESVKFAS